MSWRGFLTGALLACALSVWVGEAWAGVPAAARMLSRSEALQVGHVAVHHVGGFHGHYGAYHARYVGGYHGGFVGGYHGRYVGFYRGYYGPRYSWWYPGAFSFGLNYYRPFRSIYYYTPDYFPPVYYYSAPIYYSVPATRIIVGDARAVTIPQGFAVSPAESESIPAPVPSVAPVPSTEATFPYDGGPQKVVPLPPAPPPVVVPGPSKVVPVPSDPPPDTSAVSVVKPTKFAYPAYGEDRTPTSFAADRSAPANQQVVKRSQDK